MWIHLHRASTPPVNLESFDQQYLFGALWHILVSPPIPMACRAQQPQTPLSSIIQGMSTLQEHCYGTAAVK